jgi:hypothetical protein
MTSDHVKLIDYNGEDYLNYNIRSRLVFSLSQMPGHCRECGDKIKPFAAAGFRMKADANTDYDVTPANACRCEKCYLVLKANAVQAKGLEPMKALWTLDNIGVDNTVHTTVCYQ